ncbi:hypothetical protein D020_4564A, partial [Vibrio parahaemolyticus SBR10290]
MAGVFFF